MGFPSGSVVKNPPKYRRWGRRSFSPWVGKIPWRRKWQLTPVFLPGKSHGQRGAWQARVLGAAMIRHDWTTVWWAHVKMWRLRSLRSAVGKSARPRRADGMILVWQLETQGEPKFQVKSKGRKRPVSQLSSHTGKLPFTGPFCLRWIWELPTLGSTVCSTQSTDDMVVFSRNVLTDTPK